MIYIEPPAKLADKAQNDHGAVTAGVRAGRSKLQYPVVLGGCGGSFCALLPITVSLNLCGI